MKNFTTAIFWIAIVFAIAMITGAIKVHAGYFEDVVEETENYTAIEAMDAGYSWNTKHNAAAMIKIMEDPYANHGMTVNSELNRKTFREYHFEDAMTNAVLRMEKVIGQIGESDHLDQETKERLFYKYKNWIGETKFIETQITVVVPEYMECKQEDIINRVKEMSLQDILELVGYNK